MTRNSWNTWSPSRRIATVALAIAVAWDLAAIVRLARTENDPRAAPLVLPQVETIARLPVDDARLFSLASARRPFDDGSTTSIALSSPIAMVPINQPRLTGTVVQGTASFVVIELTDGSMRLVRLGERAAGLTLRGVTPNTGTFTDSAGRRIVLHSASTETATRP